MMIPDLSPHNLLGVAHIAVRARSMEREHYVVRHEGIWFGHVFKLYEEAGEYNRLVIDAFVALHQTWYFSPRQKHETE